MKRLLSMLIVLLVSLFASSQLQAGLLVHYDFDAVGPSLSYYESGTVSDSSGNGLTGHVVADEWKGPGNSAQATLVPGIAGSALLFDGVNKGGNADYVDVGTFTGYGVNHTLDIANAITVEAWVQPDAFTSGSDMSVIVSRADAYSLHIAGDGRLAVYIYGLTNPGYHYSNTPLSLGVWQHVAYTYDGSSVKIYIDGVLDKTVAVTGTIYTAGTWHVGIGAQINHLGYLWGGGYDRLFKGAIDEVSIYKDEALTDLDIAMDWLKGANPGLLDLIGAKITTLESQITTLEQNLATCKANLANCEDCDDSLTASAGVLGLTVNDCEIQGTNAYVAPGQLRAQQGLVNNKNAIKVIVP